MLAREKQPLERCVGQPLERCVGQPLDVLAREGANTPLQWLFLPSQHTSPMAVPP